MKSKRLISVLLVFTVILLIIVPQVDAKGTSGGARSGGASISKPSSSSINKPSSRTKSTNSNTSSKSSGSSSGSSTSSSKSSSSNPRSKSSTNDIHSTMKYKSKYTTDYVKPSGYDYSKYNGKPYYNSDNGFATTLLTTWGTFFILDNILDDGTPVYIDSETGEVIDTDTLNDINVQSIAEAETPTNTSTPFEMSPAIDSINFLKNIGYGILIIFILLFTVRVAQRSR